MLDKILNEINNALASNESVQIDASPTRFGFTKDGLGYKQGLHGFREWWALEYCMRTLHVIGACDFHYTDFHTLHIIPKKPPYKKRGKA